MDTPAPLVTIVVNNAFIVALSYARVRPRNRRQRLSVRPSVCHKPVPYEVNAHKIARFSPTSTQGTLIIIISILGSKDPEG